MRAVSFVLSKWLLCKVVKHSTLHSSPIPITCHTNLVSLSSSSYCKCSSLNGVLLLHAIFKRYGVGDCLFQEARLVYTKLYVRLFNLTTDVQVTISSRVILKYYCIIMYHIVLLVGSSVPDCAR